MNTVRQSPITEASDHDESAAAKLWTVYVSEAEKYDKALVEGWKSDMDVLLIFAGLFSASLTAFLIESYKTLTPDQGAMTIALLTQISRQLDPRLNVSSTATLTSIPFIPSTSSLACNTLWFLSLGLSLSCALIATLVEQWCRDFIQRTEMRPSPIIRARIFSYLYFGIQRFGMHTMVEFIPLLLHGSLLLFFAGLVAFFYPINTAIMVVAATLLGLVSITYTCLTVLPMFFSDSPYRTPLSTIAWSLLQRTHALFPRGRRHLLDKEAAVAEDESHIEVKHPTMVQLMKRDAAQESGDRDERDARAIVWTVRSLTDNDEIEPFVEALPDLVLGSNGKGNLRAYHNMLNMLLDDPTIHLVAHIERLLRSCNGGLLHPDILTHRRMSCIKALWAIAYFIGEKTYLTSAYSIVRWINFSSLLSFIQNIGDQLEVSPVSEAPAILKDLHHHANNLGFPAYSQILSESILAGPIVAPLVILRRSRERFILSANIEIFTEYLGHCASLDQKPRIFETICSMIRHPELLITETSVQRSLTETFITIIWRHAGLLHYSAGAHHIDIIAEMILFLIVPSPLLDVKFAYAVAAYIASRAASPQALERCEPAKLCFLLTQYLSHGPGTKTADILWALYVLMVNTACPGIFDENTLAAISTAPHVPISPCVIVVVKARMLIDSKNLPPDQLNTIMDQLQLPKFSSEEGTPLGVTERWKAASFAILVEFMEEHSKEHSSPSLLDDWSTTVIANTVNFIARQCPLDCVPGPLLQCRFANCFFQMIDSPLDQEHWRRDIINAITECIVGSLVTFFDEPIACKKLVKILSSLAQTASSTGEYRLLDGIRRFCALHSSSGHGEADEPDLTPIIDLPRNSRREHIVIQVPTIQRSQSNDAGSDTGSEHREHHPRRNQVNWMEQPPRHFDPTYADIPFSFHNMAELSPTQDMDQGNIIYPMGGRLSYPPWFDTTKYGIRGWGYSPSPQIITYPGPPTEIPPTQIPPTVIQVSDGSSDYSSYHRNETRRKRRRRYRSVGPTPKQNFVRFKNDEIPQTARRRQSRQSRRVALVGGGPRSRWALSPKRFSEGSSVVSYHPPERSFSPPLVDIPSAFHNTEDLSPMQDVDPRVISLPVHRPESGSHLNHQQRNENAAYDEEGMRV
ncbi:hypothetical protein MVEN_02361800 [Mycena venus]|uniref:DUF6535 domain-containing protein n=1 Tax=Mycena venus TaxID=2733690 RepID=A0A8H6X3F3_9AGAR|nr:hypothetical protein MVEN_02361800 [Mycena venus]